MELPIGTVIMWENSAIPAGWVVCDGSGNAPDLRSRFIRGANQDNMLKTTGGSSSHFHINSNTSTRADHDHGESKSASAGGGSTTSGTQGSGNTAASTGHSHSTTVYISGAGSHSHTMPNTSSVTVLPKHIKRVFIMKVA